MFVIRILPAVKHITRNLFLFFTQKLILPTMKHEKLVSVGWVTLEHKVMVI
jgi:hypothetical protein